VVGVTTAILEAAEVGIVHQTDIAELGALDDDQIVFVEVLALVDEFHGGSGDALLARFCKKPKR
jgi:hypothetical protein